MDKKDIEASVALIRSVGAGEPEHGVFRLPGYDHDGNRISAEEEERLIRRDFYEKSRESGITDYNKLHERLATIPEDDDDDGCSGCF